MPTEEPFWNKLLYELARLYKQWKKNWWVTSKNQINDRVRRALCSFVREELPDRVANYNKLIGFLSNS